MERFLMTRVRGRVDRLLITRVQVHLRTVVACLRTPSVKCPSRSHGLIYHVKFHTDGGLTAKSCRQGLARPRPCHHAHPG
eukprot:scaffold18594_cov54-Phaeocystis_antarctica.AAC.1